MFWKATGSKTFPKEPEDEYEIVEETEEDQVESPEDLEYNKFWAVSEEAAEFPIRRFATSLPKGSSDTKSVTAVTFIDTSPNYTTQEGLEYSQMFPNPLIVTANDNGTANVWDLHTGENLMTLREHKKKLTSIAAYVSFKDNKLQKVSIVTGSEDVSAIVWELSTRNSAESKHRLNTNGENKVHDKTISCLAICNPIPKPPIVVLGSMDKRISVWSLDEGKLLYYIQTKHTDLLLSLTCLHIKDGYEGVKIITTGWDKKIFCWSWANTEPEHNLSGHTKSVTCCASYVCHLPDTMDKHGAKVTNPKKSAIVVTGSLDKTAIIWDLESGSKSSTLVGHNGQITAVQICDDRMIMDRNQGNNNDFIDLRNSNNTPVIITSSVDQTVIIWDLISSCKIRVIEETRKILSLAIYTKDFKLLITGGMDDGTTRLWNMSRTDRIWKMNTDAVTAICTYDPRPGETRISESLVVIGTIDSTLSIFTLKKSSSGDIPHQASTHVLPDRQLTARDPMKETHDDNKKPIGVLKGHKSRINAAIIYSPPFPEQPPLVVSCDGVGSIIVWDLWERRAIKVIDGAHGINVLTVALYNPYPQHPEYMKNTASVSPTTNKPIDITRPMLLSGGGDAKIVLWDILEPARYKPDNNHGLIQTITSAHKGFVRSISVHHPIKSSIRKPTFVSASYDLTAIVWDLETCTKLMTLANVHTQYVFFNAIYDPEAHLGPPSEGETNEDKLFPTVITTSYDCTVGIWNMEKGNLKRKLIGHQESVTALGLYVPKNKQEAPLIITGSIDQLVMIWNLFTGDRLQVLVGHTDRVCFITVYVPPPTNREMIRDVSDSQQIKNSPSKSNINPAMEEDLPPLLISGGDDKINIVWEDALYQRTFMPITDAVERAFLSDCASEDWPMITTLAARYEISLFYENTHLFYLAIKHHRSDFLLKFATYLKPLLRNIVQTRHQNLLTYAIAKNDLVSVRCILLAWIDNLNEDMKDMLSQRLYHAMYYFPNESLQDLVNKYPTEFLYFICSLRLIRNHPSLLDNVPLLCLQADERYDVEGTLNPLGNYEEVWRKHAVHYVNTEENRTKEITPPSNAATVTPSSIADPKQSLPLLIREEANKLSAAKSVDATTKPAGSSTTIQQQIIPVAKKFARRRKKTKRTWTEYLGRLWYRLERTLAWSDPHPQPVTSLTIPIRNIAKLDESLMLFIESSNQLNRVDIFDAEIVIIALRYFWDNYGKRSHMISATKYAILLFLFDFSLYFYEIEFPSIDWETVYRQNHPCEFTNATDCSSDSTPQSNWGVIWYDDDTEGKHLHNTWVYSHIGMLIFNYIVLGYFGYYLLEECIQIRREMRHTSSREAFAEARTGAAPIMPISANEDPILFRVFSFMKVVVTHFFGDLWNCVDIFVVFTGIAGVLLRIIYNEDTPTGRCFLAIASVLLWFKVLYYLRPFSNSGPLVAMILLIAYHMRFFIVVLFCVLVGFMQAFWILSNINPMLTFGTVSDAFLNTFMFMLGQGLTADFEGTVSPRLAIFLLILFMLVMMILMLNLLIALMGDAFSEARSQGKALWRREQCAIVIEQRFLLSAEMVNGVPPFLHVLKYTSDVGKNDTQDASYTKFKDLVAQCSEHVTPYTSFEEQIKIIQQEDKERKSKKE